MIWNNKFSLGAVWSGKADSVHHRQSNNTVFYTKFAFGVVKQPFVHSGIKYMGWDQQSSVHHRQSNTSVSASKCAFGVVNQSFVTFCPFWASRVAYRKRLTLFLGNLYGMQGCNHTNLLFLCDVTEPKTGQNHFHTLDSPTNRYIKIYNKFNKFINLFNKFS